MPINVHFATTDRSGITRDSALVEGIHDAIFELAVDRGVITQKRAASLLKKLESARTAGQLAAVGKTVAALIAPHETKPVVIHRNRRRRNGLGVTTTRLTSALANAKKAVGILVKSNVDVGMIQAAAIGRDSLNAMLKSSKRTRTVNVARYDQIVAELHEVARFLPRGSMAKSLLLAIHPSD